MPPVDIGSAVAAIGALGTTSFALVDATKILKNGGISNSGFVHIESAVMKLVPGESRKPDARVESHDLLICYPSWRQVLKESKIGKPKVVRTKSSHTLEYRNEAPRSA